MQNPPSDDRPAAGERPTHVRVGDRVRVRRQRWRVVDVRPYDGCQLLTLAGIGDPNVGAVRRVLAPFDTVERLERSARLRIVRPQRWRRTFRALVAAAGPSGALRTARNARMDLLPHQLEPALAVVRGLGSRVLIADEVGLGKTIQAALIVSELRARDRAERILVLTPAGLREQWARELADRFGLDAVVMDMRQARQRAAGLPVGVNPWSTIPIAIASVDYVKRPEVLPAVTACRWDVVIVDEAHGVTPGSDRHRAVAVACGLATCVLLLTATPHSGDRRAFAALCELGARDHDGLLVFRRSRSEVGLAADRHTHRLNVPSNADERRVHSLLGDITRIARAERGDGNRETWLALATLHKRAFSSAWSLERTIARRLAALGPTTDGAYQQLGLPLDDGAGELDGADEPPPWNFPLMRDAARERRLLNTLAEAASAAAARETKLRALGRLLRRLARKGEPAIVFTEYRDTLLHVHDTVATAAAVLHGGLTRDERRRALDEFESGRRPVLLATDAAGEGLNLHHTCRVVINLELPWNPMRLEQRAGRVDRIGQRRTVHAFHLIGRDTNESRLVHRLRQRIARANADIGTTDPLRWHDGYDEDSMSRLVITGLSGEGLDHVDSVNSDRDEEPSSPHVVVKLAAEAMSECERVADSRRLANAGNGELRPQASRPRLQADRTEYSSLLTFSRRPALRAWLAPRILVVRQAVAEDECGRPLGSHITPMLIDVHRPLRPGALRGGTSESKTSVADLLRALNAAAPESSDRALIAWKAETLAAHAAFCAALRKREAAIELALSNTSGGSFQPGLFDRRADHNHLSRAVSRQELIDDTARRVAAIERAAAIELSLGRTSLVLVP